VIHKVILGGYTAIHKNVPLSWVPVHIAKNYYLVFSELFNKMLAVIYCRMKKFGWLTPSSI
jgi:hypothetical protein